MSVITAAPSPTLPVVQAVKNSYEPTNHASRANNPRPSRRVTKGFNYTLALHTSEIAFCWFVLGTLKENRLRCFLSPIGEPFLPVAGPEPRKRAGQKLPVSFGKRLTGVALP